MQVLKVALFGLLLGGCTVMVNGKPRRIGGGGSDPVPSAPVAAQTQSRSSSGSPAAPASAPAPAPARKVVPGQIVAVEPTLGREPLIVPLETSFDVTWSKVFGHGSKSPDCGIQIPSQPIASIDIKAQDKDLLISLVGASNDGFVVAKGDLYWTTCTHSSGDVPSMAPNDEGWAPGRYNIFPVARYGGKASHKFALELSRPSAPMTGLDQAQPLVIGGKLDKPMFVEMTIKPTGRRVLRKALSGYNCEKVALPWSPDIKLTIERPIPGLTIRPLPTDADVVLRREVVASGDDKRRASKTCAKARDGYYSSSGGNKPSYRADSELSFTKDDEGEYLVSLGTANPATETKVTLMLFDDSTKFDELTVRPFGGEKPTIEQRWIGYQMPQLATGELGTADSYGDAQRNARVFAAVPKQALVYAKLTFDKDIASGNADAFPVKNEPLVLVGLERERATVMTADGLRFSVKTSHLLLAPDGEAALPAAPRPLRELNLGRAISLLPPNMKKLGDAHHKKVEAREKCQDRAWAPYGKQLPTYTRPAGVDVVVYKSARTRQIEEAGQRAMDKKCGTDEAFAKQTEATRKKLVVEVEKGRVKLLAEATANLK
jgi:hypothetical protein